MKNERTTKISLLAIAAAILGVAFVIFKVLGIGLVATWSWLWVLAPIWIYIAYSIVVTIIASIVAWTVTRRF